LSNYKYTIYRSLAFLLSPFPFIIHRIRLALYLTANLKCLSKEPVTLYIIALDNKCLYFANNNLLFAKIYIITDNYRLPIANITFIK